LELPDDLAEHSGEDGGIFGGEVQTANEAADFFVGDGGGAGVEVAAGAEGFEEDFGNAFEIFCAGWLFFVALARELGIADEFVEGDGDGLAEVEGAMLFAGGNAQEPVAMAEVFVGEADFFGAEEKSDPGGKEFAADKAGAGFESANGMLQGAAADGGGADDESAIGDGVGDGGEFLGVGEKFGGADGGAGFAEGWLVGVDEAELGEAEVAHGAGGGADVEGIARGD